MLTFPADYFKSEYRENYFVESMMKRAWGAQLEILSRIIDICHKHDIKYFAIGGTMLGAVRHNGYIPWDDDLDIAMKRPDYDKFLKVAHSELPSEYVVISPYTEVEWMEQFARVTNSHEINFTDKFLDEYHGFPYVAGIDIFPYDSMPNDEKKQERQDYLLNLTVEARDLAIELLDDIGDATYQLKYKKLNEKLEHLEMVFGFKFNRNSFLDNQLLCLFDQIAAGFGNEHSKYITCYVNRNKRSKKGQTFRVPSYCFEEAIEVVFENIIIQIPKYYELFLTICYGKNYMKPIRAIAAHDYPFYKRQEEIVKKHGCYEAVMEAIKKSDERVVLAKSYMESFSESVFIDVGSKTSVETLNYKKAVMCCISVMDYYENEEECLKKLKSIIDIFRDNSKNIDLVLVNAPYVAEILYRKNESLADEYLNMLQQYVREGFGRLIEYGDVVSTFMNCDSYCGSYNECAKLFTDINKPVMILNKSVQ